MIKELLIFCYNSPRSFTEILEILFRDIIKIHENLIP
jgi:hypothetical protein